MQTLMINSKYDADHTDYDIDLYFKERELCIISNYKTYYVRPRCYVEEQFYNEKGRPIKRIPKVLNYYDYSFKRYYSKVLVEKLTKQGFNCKRVIISYIDRSELNKKSSFLVYIHSDWEKERTSMTKEFEEIWKNELVALFPGACKFEFEDKNSQVIRFTLPEYE